MFWYAVKLFNGYSECIIINRPKFSKFVTFICLNYSNLYALIIHIYYDLPEVVESNMKRKADDLKMFARVDLVKYKIDLQKYLNSFIVLDSRIEDKIEYYLEQNGTSL